MINLIEDVGNLDNLTVLINNKYLNHRIIAFEGVPTQASIDTVATSGAVVAGSMAKSMTRFTHSGAHCGVVLNQPNTLFLSGDHLIFAPATRRSNSGGGGVSGGAPQVAFTSESFDASIWVNWLTSHDQFDSSSSYYGGTLAAGSSNAVAAEYMIQLPTTLGAPNDDRVILHGCNNYQVNILEDGGTYTTYYWILDTLRLAHEKGQDVADRFGRQSINITLTNSTGAGSYVVYDNDATASRFPGMVNNTTNASLVANWTSQFGFMPSGYQLGILYKPGLDLFGVPEGYTYLIEGDTALHVRIPLSKMRESVDVVVAEGTDPIDPELDAAANDASGFATLTLLNVPATPPVDCFIDLRHYDEALDEGVDVDSIIFEEPNADANTLSVATTIKDVRKKIAGLKPQSVFANFADSATPNLGKVIGSLSGAVVSWSISGSSTTADGPISLDTACDEVSSGAFVDNTALRSAIANAALSTSDEVAATTSVDTVDSSIVVDSIYSSVVDGNYRAFDGTPTAWRNCCGPFDWKRTTTGILHSVILEFDESNPAVPIYPGSV